MTRFSTREAAKRLGLSPSGLSKHLRLGKIPAPEGLTTGAFSVHLWTEEDIERARKLLPKIANGRKTRGLKSKKSEVRSRKSAKSKTKKKPQPRAAVLHKKKK